MTTITPPITNVAEMQALPPLNSEGLRTLPVGTWVYLTRSGSIPLWRIEEQGRMLRCYNMTGTQPAHNTTMDNHSILSHANAGDIRWQINSSPLTASQQAGMHVLRREEYPRLAEGAHVILNGPGSRSLWQVTAGGLALCNDDASRIGSALAVTGDGDAWVGHFRDGQLFVRPEDLAPVVEADRPLQAGDHVRIDEEPHVTHDGDYVSDTFSGQHGVIRARTSGYDGDVFTVALASNVDGYTNVIGARWLTRCNPDGTPLSLTAEPTSDQDPTVLTMEQYLALPVGAEFTLHAGNDTVASRWFVATADRINLVSNRRPDGSASAGSIARSGGSMEANVENGRVRAVLAESTPEPVTAEPTPEPTPEPVAVEPTPPSGPSGAPAEESVLAEMREQIERLTRERDQAQRAHRTEMERLAAALIEQAEERDWCDEYESFVDGVNGFLTYPMEKRERSHDVRINGWVLVPFSMNPDLEFINDGEDGEGSALEAAVHTYLDNVGVEDLDFNWGDAVVQREHRTGAMWAGIDPDLEFDIVD